MEEKHGQSTNGNIGGFKPEIKQDLMYNPRDNNLKSNYIAKSPLR